jgi:hypothetical protein
MASTTIRHKAFLSGVAPTGLSQPAGHHYVELRSVYESTGKKGGIEASIVAVVMPGGVVISISGGDFPHVGAVALAEPRPSRKDDSKTSSSVSVIVRLGHKEDDLAKRLAGEVCASLNLPVVLSAGIHIDDANDRQIHDAELLAGDLVTGSIPEIRKLLGQLPSRTTRSQ